MGRYCTLPPVTDTRWYRASTNPLITSADNRTPAPAFQPKSLSDSHAELQVHPTEYCPPPAMRYGVMGEAGIGIRNVALRVPDITRVAVPMSDVAVDLVPNRL